VRGKHDHTPKNSKRLARSDVRHRRPLARDRFFHRGMLGPPLTVPTMVGQGLLAAEAARDALVFPTGALGLDKIVRYLLQVGQRARRSGNRDPYLVRGSLEHAGQLTAPKKCLPNVGEPSWEREWPKAPANFRRECSDAEGWKGRRRQVDFGDRDR
jgi:hypothetical protein